MQKFLIVFLFSIGCWLFSAEALFCPARIFSDHIVLPHGVELPPVAISKYPVAMTIRGPAWGNAYFRHERQ